MIPATRNIGAGATSLSTTDNILNIDTTLGAATITLPSVASWFELKNKSGATYDPDGLRWTDVGGAAATNNITFVAAAGDYSTTIAYNTLVGTFVVGETITGGTSGAVAVILSNNGSTIVATSISGTFVGSETITGTTSLATANTVTVTSSGDLINGATSIVVNTNGASGVITPTLDANGNGINGWEFSLVGASGGAGEYDVFGTVLIDNIFVPSLDLVGLKNIYAPNYFTENGNAINIGGTGTIVSTVNMPDLNEVYGNAIFGINDLLTSFTAQSLTVVTGAIDISGNNLLLATIGVSDLTTVGTGLSIVGTAITTLNLSALTTFSAAGSIFQVQNNTLLTAITLNPALNCTNYVFSGNALTQANVDAILALVDAGGVTRVVIAYNTLVGTFAVGETITGGTSAATAVIVSDNGSEIVANTVLGTFVNGETITGGTSTATAVSTVVLLSRLQLDGGTNATPSAAGLVSKASLVAKGWNVSNN